MNLTHSQLSLPSLDLDQDRKRDSVNVISSSDNTIAPQDQVFHNWYRFVLSFPPHLVRDYFHDFGLGAADTVLDPFCGTGTTIVEAKRCGINGIGLEANPFPCFASRVKTDWTIDPGALSSCAEQVAACTLNALEAQGIDDQTPYHHTGTDLRTLDPGAQKILIKNSISPVPLHKTIVLLDHLDSYQGKSCYNYMRLALGKALVASIGNLRFGPEVGVGKIKQDAPVVAPWLSQVRRMARDLDGVSGRTTPTSAIYLADARNLGQIVPPHSIDAIITSPPYPNEKDYTRTTRLESVVLGFFQDRMNLRAHKKNLLRSNTRGVYKADNDDQWIRAQPEIQRIAQAIEQRRIELGKTSGFERLYARTTRLYFGGMARHLAELRTILKPGAKLAYVVGDQASYLRILIRTGQLLADIAQSLGYELVRIDLFRTRFATATKQELREEVVILRWPG